MNEDLSDLIIKSATLLAKDLLVDNGLLKNNQTTEADSDDDLDLFFYSQLMKKRKISKSNELNAGITTQNRNRTTLKRPTSGRCGYQEPAINHLFLKFLRECEDITFENQFKMTRSTFQVRFFV